MSDPAKKSTMDENLDRFLRSCFPSNWGEASWGVELFRLKEMDEEHLEKAKAAVLAGLEKNAETRPVSAALALRLREAVPLLQKWLQKYIAENQENQGALRAELAYTLYHLTNDESYTPILIDAVRNAGYSDDFDRFVWMLGELPLTHEALVAVWQRLRKGKELSSPSRWKGECILFLQEKIRTPLGEAFLNSLPESERQELLGWVNAPDPKQAERNARWENFRSGTGRFPKEEINKFKEYTKIGGSPIPGMTLKQILAGHTDDIHGLTWSLDGRYLASRPNLSAEEMDAVRIWDLELSKCVGELQHPKKEQYDRYEPGSFNWISLEKNYLAVTYSYHPPTASNNHNKIAVWDVESQRMASVLYETGNGFSVNYLLRFPDGKTLVLDNWRAVSLIDVVTGRAEPILGDYYGRIGSLSVSPDGSTIAFAYRTEAYQPEKDKILFFDVRSGKVTNEIVPHHLLGISALAWMPDRRTLAVGSPDNTISIWDVDQNRDIALLQGHAGTINSLSFSSNGALLASKSENDQLLQIWRTDTWQAVVAMKEISMHGDMLAFHPSRPILASICRDEARQVGGRLPRSIRIWEFDYAAFLANPSLLEAFNRMEEDGNTTTE